MNSDVTIVSGGERFDIYPSIIEKIEDFVDRDRALAIGGFYGDRALVFRADRHDGSVLTLAAYDVRNGEVTGSINGMGLKRETAAELVKWLVEHFDFTIERVHMPRQVIEEHTETVVR